MNKLYPTIAFAALIALASGCASQDKNAPDVHGEDFVPGDQIRATQKFMTAQSSSGARHDGTLHAQHFNGKELGSLGERKLDLMLQDDDVNEPFTVYVNLPKDNVMTTARSEAVTRYLKDNGLSDEQIKVEIGENPGSYAPTATNIAAMSAPTAPAAAPSDAGGSSMK